MNKQQWAPHTAAMCLVTLPDGTPIWAPSATEAAVLYHELIEEAVYSKHGIEIGDGACVFDVGANIGLYTLLLVRAHHNLRVFAFEPVPPVYELLCRNLELYRGDACVRTFKCALGRTPGSATIELEPGLSFAATLRPWDVAAAACRDANLVEWARALMLDMHRTGQLPRRWARLLQVGLDSPRSRNFAVGAVLAVATGVRMRAAWRSGLGLTLRKRRFECQVRTLSEIFSSASVPPIDVLKIDVEGSEWEVLAGIASEHWPRVRQVVLEVHDVAGRLSDVQRLLERNGFRTDVEQEDWALHRLLGIFTIYGRRAD